jgi:5'-methylthioadenosine phosphorylase
MLAIIGGSGFEKFDGFETLGFLPRETPFGLAASGFRKVSVGSHEALFISRHGEHHELSPSEINYRANIYALKAHGARHILSFSAVGSLRENLPPGKMVIPTQYIDRTKSLRRHTFGGEGVVSHVSLAHPICESGAKWAETQARASDVECTYGGTYVCIEGPNFSTYAESMMFRDLKADIIGMTNFPEYSLAREAGLSYVPCCFVTDYDCWDTSRPHVTVEEVIRTMRANNAKAFKFLATFLASGNSWMEECNCAESGMRSGLMTAKEALSAEQKSWMQVLME